jgi:hypothetical protein
MKTAQFRPLVLLDVDGVINDLEVLAGQRRPWRTDLVHSNGFAVMVPDYMPALIQALVDTCEVWWCTTWRDRANSEIASHLGIPDLPVVTDGSLSRRVDWKAGAAYELVTAALGSGRSVYWIEDFYGDPPEGELPPGVVFIDTTLRNPRCVLHEDDLPNELRQRLAGTTPSREVA